MPDTTTTMLCLVRPSSEAVSAADKMQILLISYHVYLVVDSQLASEPCLLTNVFRISRAFPS